MIAHLRHGNALALRRRWLASDGALRQWVDGSSNRMNLGGSLNNPAINVRSANRDNNAPTIRNDDLGARPAKTSTPPDRADRCTASARSAP